MAVGSLVLGAVGAYQQYEGGKAQAKVYEQQADIDRMAAVDAQAQGDRETERMLWRTRQALGSQRAAIAANGLDASFGTPNELLGETAYFGAMEQADTRLNAARQAWGYQVSATNAGNKAEYSRWAGKTQGATTLLGSLFQAGSMASGGFGGGKGKASIGPVQREAIPVSGFRVNPGRF